MGIISAAMAAAGNSGVESMNQNIEQMNRQELMDKQAAINSDADQRRSDLETQKQLVILQAQKKMAIDAANQQRESQIARINQAIPALVQNQIDTKYADANAAAAGKTDSPLTPEQQAVIDQSKAADKTALANDPHSYIKAAMATGDIDPHTVAQLAQQADAIRRQELSQQAQFEHADKSQKESFAHADRSQLSAQAFAARQQANQIAAANSRNSAPEDLSETEKQNWVTTFIRSGGTVPRSAPAWVRNNVGSWAAQAGITSDDIKSGAAQAKYDAHMAGAAGNRAGAMAGVEAVMPMIADNAIEASKNVPRGRFVPLNQLMLMSEEKISDPALTTFKAANQALTSEYQMVISRGGSNVFALKEAMGVLNKASSPEAYEAAVRQVKKEVEFNQQGMSNLRESIGKSHAPVQSSPIKAPTDYGKKNKPSLNDIFGG